MTIYFAPPGEPIDGDNWQELGMLDTDGLQFEQDRLGAWQGAAIDLGPIVDEVTVEITPELNLIHALPTKASLSFDFKPSREFTNAFFGFDIYALADTVAEWFTRPPAPIPPIERGWTLTEIQDRVNRVAILQRQATTRNALEESYPSAQLRHSR